MDKTDYFDKMLALLSNSTYKKTKADPTTYLEKVMREKIKNSSLDADTQQRLIPKEKSSITSKLYGSLKIHKPEVPLRPISSVETPLQALTAHLAKILQPAV